MICDKCKEDKDLNSFEHQKNRPNPRKTCKSCRYSARKKSPSYQKELIRHREYSKQRRKSKPDEVRMTWERSVYGVCKEDFGYSECWICGEKNRLCIDHCHETGDVRGLLCSSCNIALGGFRDKKELLMKAVDYLDKDGPHYQLPWRDYDADE